MISHYSSTDSKTRHPKLAWFCIAHNQLWYKYSLQIHTTSLSFFNHCPVSCVVPWPARFLHVSISIFNIEHSEISAAWFILTLCASALCRGKSSLYVNRSPPVSVKTPDCSLKAQPLPGDPLTSVAWALQGKQLPDQHATQVWLVFLFLLAHKRIKRWTAGPSRENPLNNKKNPKKKPM